MLWVNNSSLIEGEGDGQTPPPDGGADKSHREPRTPRRTNYVVLLVLLPDMVSNLHLAMAALTTTGINESAIA